MISHRLKRFTLAALILIGCIFQTSLVSADEIYRPRHPNELPLGTVRERAIRVTTVQIEAFNRFAIERDFEETVGLSDDALVGWLKHHVGFINENQLKLTGIRNGPIQLDENDVRDLFVEPGSGRGGHVVVGHRLMSLKANGSTWWNAENVKAMIRAAARGPRALAEVRKRDHSSGLEDAPGAAAEYIRHLAIQADYDQRRNNGEPSKETVEVYCVFSWGFSVFENGREVPAYGIARQANFGRTGHNQRTNEIYSDFGLYQETYFGARVDFGGARLSTESEGQALHQRAEKLPARALPLFIKTEAKRIVRAPSVARAPEPKWADLIAELDQDVEYHQGWIVAAVINHVRPRPRQYWYTETQPIARLKYQLLRMDAQTVRASLAALSPERLTKLFLLSSHDFQMPLPAAAYAFGFEAETDVRRSAIRAAIKVFDRFPELVAPAIALSLAHVADPVPEDDDKGNEITPEIFAMIAPEREYPDYEDLLYQALTTGTATVQHAALKELTERRHLSETLDQAITWIQKHQKRGPLRLQAEIALAAEAPSPCARFLEQVRAGTPSILKSKF